MRVTEKFLVRFLKSTMPIRTDTRIDNTISITIAMATTAMIIVFRLPLSSVEGMVLPLLLFELSTDTGSVVVVLSASCLVGVGVITEMLSKLSPGGVESSVGKDSSVTEPVVVDSSVTSSVVATVVTMDPDGSVVTGGTEVG